MDAINGPKRLIYRINLYAGDRALQQNNCFSMKLGFSHKLKPKKIKLYFHIRDDHGAGVDSGQSLHFRLEQEPESIF